MNQERLKKFQETYKSSMIALEQDNPSYFMPGRSASQIADLFNAKIASGGLRAITVPNSDGFKRTCKALGIKQTYKAIEAYLNGENN